MKERLEREIEKKITNRHIIEKGQETTIFYGRNTSLRIMRVTPLGLEVIMDFCLDFLLEVGIHTLH